MLKDVVKVATKVYKNSYIDSLFVNENKMTSASILEQYEQNRKDKKLLDFDFSKATPEGDLTKEIECGVTVVMRKRDTDPRLLRLYNPSMRLGLQYQVVVKKVDYDNDTVYVSSVDSRNEVREEIIEAIEEGIAKEEFLILPAVVTRIVQPTLSRDSMLYIDIAKMHIFGTIRLSEWSTTFTESFDYCTKVGAVINVAVINKSEWKTGIVYDCSRRLTLAEDIWEGIEEKYPKNTKLRITCTSKRDKNFFGIINGVPDLKVLCEYPVDKRIEIRVGAEYIGYVYRASEERKLLSARIMSEIKSDDDERIKYEKDVIENEKE